MWKPSFLTIYAQQNLKGCVAWALLSISADWLGCYAKYPIFKDTSWTEILHVVVEFHSTILHGQTVPLCLMEKKWVSMFDLYWRAFTFNEDKGWFWYKKSFWHLPWDHCYKEKKRNLKNKNIQKIAVKRYCLPSSFYPLEVAFLKPAKWI